MKVFADLRKYVKEYLCAFMFPISILLFIEKVYYKPDNEHICILNQLIGRRKYFPPNEIDVVRLSLTYFATIFV